MKAQDTIQFLIRLGESGRKNTSEKEIPARLDFEHSYDFLKLVAKLKTDDIVTLIKGRCLYESSYRPQMGCTSRIDKLLDLLEERRYSGLCEVIDWLLANRNNPYIPWGKSVSLGIHSLSEYDDSQRRYKKYLKEIEELNQKCHAEAQERKRRISAEHISRSKERKSLREKESEYLRSFSKKDQLKKIIDSGHPLDFYPGEFANISKSLILNLSKSYREHLFEKLKCTRRKGDWRYLQHIIKQTMRIPVTS